VVFNPVNVGDLDRFDAGTEITPDLLRQAGLAKKKGPIKVLGNGEIDKALTVKVHAASDSARSKIEAAGGTVELIES
jgi:large subunit ribosomal protein L15